MKKKTPKHVFLVAVKDLTSDEVEIFCFKTKSNRSSFIKNIDKKGFTFMVTEITK